MPPWRSTDEFRPPPLLRCFPGRSEFVSTPFLMPFECGAHSRLSCFLSAHQPQWLLPLSQSNPSSRLEDLFCHEASSPEHIAGSSLPSCLWNPFLHPFKHYANVWGTVSSEIWNYELFLKQGRIVSSQDKWPYLKWFLYQFFTSISRSSSLNVHFFCL